MIENIPRILFVDLSQLSVGLSELRSLTMRLLNPDTLIFVLFLLPWSVAAWAMLMMTIAALGDDRLSFDWFFGGSLLWESYNRKYGSASFQGSSGSLRTTSTAASATAWRSLTVSPARRPRTTFAAIISASTSAYFSKSPQFLSMTHNENKTGTRQAATSGCG